MKLLLPFFLFVTIHCFAQDRNETKNKLNIASSITIDNVNNMSGGLRNGSSFLALFDLNMNYSFNKGFLRNTSFNGHILKTTGDAPSENYIGDIQVASNIDGKCPRFLYEMYIKQKIGDLSLTAGLHDLNSEFVTGNYAGDFINSSFGIFPAITLNTPVSIFPLTTFGGLASFNKKHFSIITGFYNLNHSFMEEDEFQIENHLYQKGHIGITEIQYRLFSANKLLSEFKIGSYFTECQHYSNEIIPDECTKQTNYGYYLLIDQLLHQFQTNEEIGAFLQIGTTPEKLNLASEYYGGGISFRSDSKSWLPEQIGLALGHVKLNQLQGNEFRDIENYESVIEFTASKEILNRLKIQPDLQYIINPSGQFSDATVGIIRLQMELN